MEGPIMKSGLISYTKHGLLLPTNEIEPYDITLKTMSIQQKKKMGRKSNEPNQRTHRSVKHRRILHTCWKRMTTISYIPFRRIPNQI